MPKAQEIVIVGAGTLGALVYDCLDGDDRWFCTAFHDDGKAGGSLHGLPIYGTGPDRLPPGQRAIIAIGDPTMRRALVERLEPQGIDWQTFVDRRSAIGRRATLGQGTVVLVYASIPSGVIVGPFCYFNGYSSAGAGAQIGAYTSLLGGASVVESVVGAECLLGVHSLCLDGATLGDRVTVAPMTVIRRRSVPAGALVAGNPARVLRRKAPGRPISATGECRSSPDPRSAILSGV